MTANFNTKLTSLDFELHKKLWVLLKAEGRSTFTSDDFRMYNLDQFIEDKQHGIGGLFARMKINKLIEPTGRMIASKVPSNHGHKIQEYRMKGLETTPMLLRES